MSRVANGGAVRRPLADRVQGALGAGALGLVLVSVLLPVVWTLLALALLTLFLGQLAIDVASPPGEASRRLASPAFLYIVALVWAHVQIWPGALPQWADPAWSRVPGAAPRISADPVEGAHALVRLAAYGMVFWIIVRTAERSGRPLNLLVGLALFSTVLAAFGIYWAWVGANPVLGDSATARVTATFVNRNSYATYALLGLIANVALYIDRSSRAEQSASGVAQRLRDFLEGFFRGNWVFALGALLCLAAILFTESRAGTVAALLALGAVAFAMSGDGRIRNPWVVLSAAAIVIFAGLFLSGAVGGRLATTGPDEMRFEVYRLVAQAIASGRLAGSASAPSKTASGPISRRTRPRWNGILPTTATWRTCSSSV